jgi:hypothetical protein
VKSQPVEPDRLDQATAELAARGLMRTRLSADVAKEGAPEIGDKVPDRVLTHGNAKAASL